MSFNAGSTFGVNQNLWKVSAVAAVATLNGGIGGGIVGIIVSMIVGKGKVYISETVNSVLGGLVAITGVCPLASPAEALIIGSVGGLIAVLGQYLMERIKIDDPVGAVPVHMLSAAWGTLAVGLFAKDITGKFSTKAGLVHSGSFHQLYVQIVGLLAVTVWSAVTTMIGFVILDKTMGIRTSLDEEILGADWTHHNIQTDQFNNELFDDVIDKLSAKNVNEEVAGHVLKELRAQLMRAQRSRANTPAGKPPTSPPAVEIPPTRSTQRNPSRISAGSDLSRPQSRKAQLQEIVDAAVNTQHTSRFWKTQLGPMMMPLYKSYTTRVRTPTTPRPTNGDNDSMMNHLTGSNSQESLKHHVE